MSVKKIYENGLLTYLETTYKDGFWEKNYLR